MQDISEDDALAEGCHGWEKPEDDAWMTARDVYEELWDSINAKRGFSWSSNPWVWVVSFRLAAPQQTLAAELFSLSNNQASADQPQPAEA